jgi:hypothetical protein
MDEHEQGEAMVVVDLVGAYGWARRRDGSDLFFHINDCQGVQADVWQRWNLLKRGVPLWAGTKIRKDRLRAADIRLYSEDEIREDLPDYFRPIEQNVPEPRGFKTNRFKVRHERTAKQKTLRGNKNWWQHPSEVSR